MSRGPEWVAAYEQLDAAVMELHRLMEKRDPEPPAVPVDYVLVVGSTYFDDDGDRGGLIRWFPKNGSQPSYITKGLLKDVLDGMNYHRTGETNES